MNEALQSALAGLIAKLTEVVTSVGGVVDRIPELVTQMIGFQIMKYWIWIGAESVAFLILPFIIHKLLKTRDGDWAGTAFCLGIICLGAGISIVWDVTQLVKLYNFPLVWILDYLKDLAAK